MHKVGLQMYFRSRRTAVVTLGAFYASLLLASAPRPASARVNPLELIKRQIQKANMLIVLDTSGSMNGVPGGVFTYSTEVGVDCDNGVDCRAGGAAGTCVGNPSKVCTSDQDCRVGSCQQGGDACGSDLDCPGAPAHCETTLETCAADSDCPAINGTCSVTGSCTSRNRTCPATGRCQYDANGNGPGPTCTPGGAACALPTGGRCQQDASITCTTTDNSNCPLAATGTCSSGVTPPGGCSSNNDCPGNSGACRYGGAPCTALGDCPDTQDVGGTCSRGSTPGGGCQNDNDCPGISNTTCSLGGASCANNNDCKNLAGNSCANDAACNPGRCAMRPSQACAGNSGCRFQICTKNDDASDYGNVFITCASDNDCQGNRRCRSNVTTPCARNGSCNNSGYCRDPEKSVCVGTHQRATCNGRPTKLCTVSGIPCTDGSQCPGSGNRCEWPANRCDGIGSNPCNRPRTACNVSSTNACNAVANNCNAPSNVCIPGSTNRCLGGITNDTCMSAPGSTPGPIMMCRTAQTRCTRAQDCPAGDTCGPATSRTVMAKRALTNIVQGNFNLINFGLMTFWQSGYFPYYRATSTSSTTLTAFHSRQKLEAAGCFDPATGPTASCLISGIPQALVASTNSRYRVHLGGASFTTSDQNWCGEYCATTPGMGHYVGSTYRYTATTGTYSSTVSVQTSYIGKARTISGDPYLYYQSNPAFYNGGALPPMSVINCNATGACGARCGGRWDTQLAPFLDTSGNPTTARGNALAISANFEKASYGGLVTYHGTPSGCTLENNGASGPNTSAYHYMSAVMNGDAGRGIPADTLSCRGNFVLFITDGAANGPGDVNPSNGASICDSAACAAADPQAAGCTCRSVLAAWHMRQNLGVRTYVVGFSGDVQAGQPRVINDNIARAGGTDNGNDGVAPYALLATNEVELESALQRAVFDAVRGSYATSPAASSSGTQQTNRVDPGTTVLDSRVDFPSWKGHLLAYDASGSTPTLMWDAAVLLANMNWWERRVYTWDGAAMVRIAFDPSTRTMSSSLKTKLRGMGLGATDDEAEKIARWMLGDPAMRNPAILGSIINSTPIDVGQPGNSPLPGGNAFYLAHRDRPNLTYVGADDGMLHAFFTRAATVGSTNFAAGSEAFAFIPQDMFRVVTRQYVLGGQPADPARHIFGLANSPKVKNLCISRCDDPAAAVWKTLLMMPAGYGENESFVLDITAPFSSAGVADPPVTMKWHTESTSAGVYEGALGLTISVPAFFLNKTTGLDDFRVIFGSGYPVDPSSTTQGRQVVTASAATGTVIETRSVSPNSSCALDLALLGDVATARDFAAGQDNKLLAAYLGDTHGRLWRSRVGIPLAQVADLDCNHPLVFSPAVVQLDRDDPANHARDIYLVQVTNSALDDETRTFPPSKIVLIKEKADAAGVVTTDSTFGTAGKVVLTVGVDNQICGVTGTNGACTTPMPAGARPTGTPIAILRRDGSGFIIMALWYTPAPNGCGKGTTYLTIHQVLADAVSQRLGLVVGNEPVISPVIVGGKVVVVGSAGATNISSSLGVTLTPGTSAPTTGARQGAYGVVGWTELVD